jgi:hypothetical protein
MFPGSLTDIRYVARGALAALLIAGEPRALGVGRREEVLNKLDRPVGDIVLVKPWRRE